MTTNEMIEKYKEWVFKCSAYNMALSLIGFDKQTIAPVQGEEYRDERAAFLSGELFSISTDPQMMEIMKTLKEDDTIDPDIKKAAQLYYDDMLKTVCIPKDEYVKWQKLTNESFNNWRRAKEADDYSIFEPYLKKVIEGSKKLYEYRGKDMPVYDQMLDDFEPGMNRDKYDAFFDALKERLVPLIQKVKNAKKIDDSFLYQKCDIESQKKFMEYLLDYLGYDKSWGYQNESEHPFTDWVCENDCRTTTKYLEDNMISAVFSTIHECGHAWYEHNIDPKYDGMILSNGVSSGMHESQSRLCENYLGRTKAFWEANYDKLKECFPKLIGDVSLDDFIKAVNVSTPSLVRTEADELTYPMHILIRYEIEKGLFDGTISTEGLDKTWADKYEEYLGIRPESARDGILQDVHWSDASFGYFPTYALGSAFSAQFMDAMRKDIDVDEYLRDGRYV
ncbi:MAG: carboxypeptidase M32, partial [Butyrivibrio sp.]|uniref:carboxypeptidase M32 n=1 Tax=Butyrivibrio sp. TaxID=28121 RepID=UPI0025F3D790